MGSRMVPFKRVLVTSYNKVLHSNFSSILKRFRDIAAFMLQCAIFPTQVSPNFSMFPWE